MSINIWVALPSPLPESEEEFLRSCPNHTLEYLIQERKRGELLLNWIDASGELIQEIIITSSVENLKLIQVERKLDKENDQERIS